MEHHEINEVLLVLLNKIWPDWDQLIFGAADATEWNTLALPLRSSASSRAHVRSHSARTRGMRLAEWEGHGQKTCAESLAVAGVFQSRYSLVCFPYAHDHQLHLSHPREMRIDSRTKKNKSGPNRITKIDRRISLVWMYQSREPRIAGSHQCGRFNDRFFSVFRRTTAVDQENQIASHAIPPILVDNRVLSGRQPAFEWREIGPTNSGCHSFGECRSNESWQFHWMLPSKWSMV